MTSKTAVSFLMGILLVGCGQDRPSPDGSSADTLTPTGLTIVATDSDYGVLDVVAVPDDQASLLIEFTVEPKHDEIHVFALGRRIHDQLPSGFVIIGIPEKADGLGVVSAKIEDGMLIGIDGNGVEMNFEVSDQLKKDIEKDLNESSPSPITRIVPAD